MCVCGRLVQAEESGDSQEDQGQGAGEVVRGAGGSGLGTRSRAGGGCARGGSCSLLARVNSLGFRIRGIHTLAVRLGGGVVAEGGWDDRGGWGRSGAAARRGGGRGSCAGRGGGGSGSGRRGAIRRSCGRASYELELLAVVGGHSVIDLDGIVGSVDEGLGRGPDE